MIKNTASKIRKITKILKKLQNLLKHENIKNKPLNY